MVVGVERLSFRTALLTVLFSFAEALFCVPSLVDAALLALFVADICIFCLTHGFPGCLEPLDHFPLHALAFSMWMEHLIVTSTRIFVGDLRFVALGDSDALTAPPTKDLLELGAALRYYAGLCVRCKP